MSDPVQVWRRRARLSVAGSLAVGVLAVGWAFRPIRVPVLPELTYRPIDGAETALASEASVFDPAAFDVPLWVPREAESEVVTEPDSDQTPAPTLDFELIGITDNEGARVAALYDRAHDRIRLVADGESLNGLSVAVGPRSVVLGEGPSSQVIAMTEVER